MNSNMTNGMIIAEVTKRASHRPVDMSDEAWRFHWVTTGKMWAKQLRAEGLEETAKTVDKHIEWFERQLNE